MTDDRFVDFDNFMRELGQPRPLIVRVRGQDYELPGSLPASIALAGVRLMADDQATIPPSAVVGLAEGLFGKEMLDELIDKHRLTVPELKALIEMVVGRYNAEASPSPNRATRRAAKHPSRST